MDFGAEQKNSMRSPKKILAVPLRARAATTRAVMTSLSVFLLMLVHGAHAANTICGSPTQPLNATTANVLIVGDSISMGSSGYGQNVRAMLEQNVNSTAPGLGQLANVQHAGGWGGGGQALSTAHGITCIDGYLSGPNQTAPLAWDVVTINFGLHDCDTRERVHAGCVGGVGE